jgi:hypothetical protein
MIKNNIFESDIVDHLIGEDNYADAAELLFNEQFKEWNLMRENYKALKNVILKSFWFDGFKFKTQFNPERIKSTSADVGKETLNKRSCFLCAGNLPSEQKGILILDEYILLCNPYPIFPQHFTVSFLQHKPQSVKENIKDFLKIAKLLSKKYTLIYNGPDCGASAPDHLHFQAGTKLFMPLENDINQLKNDSGKILFENEKITLSFIDDGLRTIVFIEALEKNEAADIFNKFYKCYSNLSSSPNEPKMNILCNYDEEFGFSVIIFLRSKHRPNSFYESDEKKIIISPATVDLGGLLITPREKDFERLDKELIEKLVNEVALDSSSFNEFEKMLKTEFG